MLIKVKFKKIFLILLVLLSSSCFISAVSAGEITIDNSANIQGAIDSVIASDESGVVNLKSGTYKLGGNSLNLSSDKLLTINGLGSDNSRPVIDAESQSGIFNVSPDSRLVLNNVIFKNAYSNKGSVVSIDEGILEISNCDFIGNTALNGGVIYSGGSNSIVFINNSQFIQNAADNGAVLFVYGSSGNILSITNSTFSENRANVNGAVIFSLGDTSSITLVHSIFSKNLASLSGGVVFVNSNISRILIGTCNFTNNSANEGGVFYSTGNYLEVNAVNSRFIENSANLNGGVIANFGLNTISILSTSVLSKNNANRGSVIYQNGSGGNSNIKNSLILDNIGSNLIFNSGSSSFIANNNFWGTADLVAIKNSLYNVNISIFYLVKLSFNSVSKYGDILTVSSSIFTQDGQKVSAYILPEFDFHILYNGKKINGDLINTVSFTVDKFGENILLALHNNVVLHENAFDINSKGEISSVIIKTGEAIYNKKKNIIVEVKNHNGIVLSGIVVYLYLGGKKVAQGITDDNGIAKIPYKFKKVGNLTISAKTLDNDNYQGSSLSKSKIFVPKSVLKIKTNVYSKKSKDKFSKIKRTSTFKMVVGNKGPKKTSFKLTIKVPKGFKSVLIKITNKKSYYKSIKYGFNSKKRTLTLKVNNLKSKKSIKVNWKLNVSKKGVYSIKSQIKKDKLVKLSGNYEIKKFKVK